jgi:hypothetical protein
MRRSETGQATVEWTALVLVVAIALSAIGFAVSTGAAWRLGHGIFESILCAAGDGCPNALEDAYGERLAAAVRRYAPNIAYEHRSAELPVDFRRCREIACSNGPDRAEATAESGRGLPVTAFTHVVDRRRAGGALYVQYWLYFPESFTAGIGRKLGPLASHWPGFHADDWEGYQVRVAPGGATMARATAHGGYVGEKGSAGWGSWTGWYRVSGGSHAGHLVSGSVAERTTPRTELKLVPLEELRSTDLYRFEISPPWAKGVYVDPESLSS